MTYSTTGSVIPYTRIRRERWPGGYHTKVIPLVYPGQEVLPDQPIMRIEPQVIVDAVQAGPRLSLPSIDTNLEMQAVVAGQTGQAGIQKARIPQIIPAGMYGRVVSITARGGVVIESHATLIRGAIGAGNQVAGKLTMWYASSTNTAQQAIPPGAILVIPGPLHFSMLRQAMHSGVSGIVASSIVSRDLEGFLATDLIELLNGQNVEKVQARLPALTLFLTEGLGSLAMSARIINLLSQYQGSLVLLSGITSTRQGIFPELLISIPEKDIRPPRYPQQGHSSFALGTAVHVCGGPYEGATGVVDYLFSHQQQFASGIRARAVRLRLEDGTYVVVPLVLVEAIN